ncbi:hypothetical protein GEMRC1_003841 [Eukaryota sp. GEM-RC1]
MSRSVDLTHYADDSILPLSLVLPSINLEYISLPPQFSSLCYISCSHNPLKQFDSITRCSNLLYLDLSNSHLSRFPSSNFWSLLSSLKILLLHDNSFSSLSAISSLLTIQSLKVLRLDGNPLTRHVSYRHFVVNSFFSLILLDHHVISDSEVINGLNWSSTFPYWQALSDYACFDWKSLQGSSDLYGLQHVSTIFSNIFLIQKVISPIILIQRVFRGWKARKQTMRIYLVRYAASLEIQRVFRGYLVRKNLKN